MRKYLLLMNDSEETFVKKAPLSVLHTLADHYSRDAWDYLERFDVLWERMLHKMGRTKTFVDLMFACECALKAHIILGRIEDEPTEVYRSLRRLGHDIEALADTANFMKERDVYQSVKDRFGTFSIFFRYSLDAYETFFPSAIERENALINFSKTIGNHGWVLESRANVGLLLDSIRNQLGGLVTNDLLALLQHEEEMKKFADQCMRAK